MSKLLYRKVAYICGLLSCMTFSVRAMETETLYLSGKGKDDPVKWDFMCSAGQNANRWSTIGVPSNWELQGFGIYTYGNLYHKKSTNQWPKVQGHYKRTFSIPARWGDKRIFIVFEGVMTDTQLRVNGQSAGPMHQGGYYRFKYDITSLIHAGENLLEVTVDDESANKSVNGAERRGDYWNYGGIYRPVYLEAVPPQYIERIAINAKADGALTVDVTLAGKSSAQTEANRWLIEAQVLDADARPVGKPFSVTLNNWITTPPQIAAKFDSPRLWTAETPALYQLEVRLKTATADAPIHTIRQKFGFRTFEARGGQGLFLNGRRIMLKGCCRHSFWPDSGRCLTEQISRQDIQLMKDMNMNAVRMSHYPPDQHFLDECDELGLYVLDELAGWHNAYDTPTGIQLVEEMVTRDVNHPSILFWDNGNEGGWNKELDGEFAKWDSQQRWVLHPFTIFNGIDTKHYVAYDDAVVKASGDKPFFPTEFLHGLYDGGAGAGLEDYWKVMMAGKAAGGGFIWAFLDEDVVRTDKGGRIDSMGNAAPDGILGPYREKEGSFYTIKQVWSPIIITRSEDGKSYAVENRYAFTDARQCSFVWEWRQFKSPAEVGASYTVTGKGVATVENSIPPGATGSLQLDMTSANPTAAHDALAITAKDPFGRELWTWVWNDNRKPGYFTLPDSSGNAPTVAETPEGFQVQAGELALQFDRNTGLLAAANRAGKSFSLARGPRLLVPGTADSSKPDRDAPAPAPVPDSTLASFTHQVEGSELVLSAVFNGPMKSITYRVSPNGWLTIDYEYNLTGPRNYFGVGFDYPESKVKGMRYLGNGPAPVFQNRLAGGWLDVWDRKYNNTTVGDPDDLAPGQHFDYPVFNGYYAGVRWLQLDTDEGPITALIRQNDLYVQVFRPKLPPPDLERKAIVAYSKASIAFLHAIDAIGNKFSAAEKTGPHGQPATAQGDYKGKISLFFGNLPKS